MPRSCLSEGPSARLQGHFEALRGQQARAKDHTSHWAHEEQQAKQHSSKASFTPASKATVLGPMRQVAAVRGLVFLFTLLLLTTTFVSSWSVSYFAFGSNMNLEVIRGRRGVRSTNHRAAILRDHELRFSLLGMNPFEPSFASIEPCRGKEVHGVLMDMPVDDYFKLCASEGVPLAYHVYPISVQPYSSQHSTRTERSQTAALSFKAVIASPVQVPPSKRYMRLLHQGALQHKLDAKYVQQYLK